MTFAPASEAVRPPARAAQDRRSVALLGDLLRVELDRPGAQDERVDRGIRRQDGAQTARAQLTHEDRSQSCTLMPGDVCEGGVEDDVRHVRGGLAHEDDGGEPQPRA